MRLKPNIPQVIPPIVAPDIFRFIQEISSHGRKKHMTAMRAPAGLINIFTRFSTFMADFQLFISRVQTIGNLIKYSLSYVIKPNLYPELSEMFSGLSFPVLSPGSEAGLIPPKNHSEVICLCFH